MNHPLLGINYLCDGFSLIFKPGIKRFVIIPLLINVLLFVGLFFLFRHGVLLFNQWLLLHLPNWLHSLSIILWLLFLMSFILLFLYTFVTIANLIAAPFNSLLAEKVAFYLTGSVSTPRRISEHLSDVPRIVGRQLAILWYYLPRALLLFILFFVPLLQLIAPLLWFLFNAWFLTLTYVDYPTDNQHIALQQVRRWLKQRRGLALCFGIGALVATLIPVLNFIAIPAAVAGATKLWVEENR